MKIEKQIENLKDNQKGYLALPFDENQFAAFVKGLLGTPQTITKKIRGNFEIQLKDLQNFHDLLDQRITQQNNGKLIQLKTQVYYNDESSVILSSYEELITYNEVKPVISEAVRMTWTYLIQFSDKDVPEKQEIELMFVATPYRSIIEDDDIPVVFPSYGQARIVVKHTARTWGTDIESLMTNQVESIFFECSKFKEFLRKKSTTIGILTAVLFLISSLIGIYYSTRVFIQAEVIKVSEFLKGNLDVNSKADYLINYIATNGQNLFFLKSLLFVVVSIFVAIILGSWVDSKADNKTRSYLVLTREAKKKRDALVLKSKRQFLFFWLSIAISIVTSVVANFIFRWMTGV